MNQNLKDQIIQLRAAGRTYTEIQDIIGQKVQKSTLSYICKGVILNEEQKKRISTKIQENLILARKKSIIAAKIRKQERLDGYLRKNGNLGKIIRQENVAKVALAMLFLGEGSKTNTSCVVFGNSNPIVIGLFLNFFRKCYQLDEKKFRCTVQCRVDQNPEELKKFWSRITKIPLKQFYKTQVDPRTMGKPSKKPDYKGVCRIDYLSADVVYDLNQAIKVIELKGL